MGKGTTVLLSMTVVRLQQSFNKIPENVLVAKLMRYGLSKWTKVSGGKKKALCAAGLRRFGSAVQSPAGGLLLVGFRMDLYWDGLSSHQSFMQISNELPLSLWMVLYWEW